MGNIRNFCIISHIDHGKSTLADRFLEMTETVLVKDMQERYLDDMELEKERGITIKLQPVRMKYKHCILNMIDTPGHVDFSYEVSRSLSAVEGAVLLVDATKGIQAQTLANLNLAKEKGEKFVIIPVINKIDLQNARVEETEEEVKRLLGVRGEEIIKISAKEGTNVEKVLDAVIERVPSPAEQDSLPFRALVFDSEYNSYKGIIAHIRVVEGSLSKEEPVSLFASGADGEAKDIGFFAPKMISQKKLSAGEIGYICTGIKETGAIRSGDTMHSKGEKIKPLPGYKEPMPMVFSSFYPKDASCYHSFRNALQEISLTDPAFTFVPDFKEAFGRGFRCGFLGSLHSEIISERLRREFNLDLIVSAPSVTFNILNKNGEKITVHSASDWPDESLVQSTQEPWVRLEVITPSAQMGGVTEVLGTLKGSYLETKYMSAERVMITYEAPLRRVIIGFHDRLKSATKGYASAGYEITDFRVSKLVKMEVLVASRVEEAFSKIISRDEVFEEGKKTVSRLKEAIPAEQFAVPLQARVGGKIVARETISARRKDVTGHLYGGDYTRKRKLLEKQKKGKKKLAQGAKVNIPQEAFLKVFKDD